MAPFTFYSVLGQENIHSTFGTYKQVWDPYPALDITKNIADGKRCIGWAQSYKRQCINPIGRPARAEAQRLLNEMSFHPPQSAGLFLPALAGCLLCVRNHQGENSDIVKKWTVRIIDCINFQTLCQNMALMHQRNVGFELNNVKNCLASLRADYEFVKAQLFAACMQSNNLRLLLQKSEERNVNLAAELQLERSRMHAARGRADSCVADSSGKDEAVKTLQMREKSEQQMSQVRGDEVNEAEAHADSLSDQLEETEQKLEDTQQALSESKQAVQHVTSRAQALEDELRQANHQTAVLSTIAKDLRVTMLEKENTIQKLKVDAQTLATDYAADRKQLQTQIDLLQMQLSRTFNRTMKRWMKQGVEFGAQCVTKSKVYLTEAVQSLYKALLNERQQEVCV